MISKRKITTITFHFLSFRSLTIFEINIERFGKKLFSKISTNNRSNLNRDLKFWLFQGRRRNSYNWLEINGKRFRKIQQTDSIPRVDSLYSKWYVKFHDHEALFGYGSISKVAPFSFVLLGRRIFHVEKDSTIVSIHRWPINRRHTTLYSSKGWDRLTSSLLLRLGEILLLLLLHRGTIILLEIYSNHAWPNGDKNERVHQTL